MCDLKIEVEIGFNLISYFGVIAQIDQSNMVTPCDSETPHDVALTRKASGI